MGNENKTFFLLEGPHELKVKNKNQTFIGKGVSWHNFMKERLTKKLILRSIFTNIIHFYNLKVLLIRHFQHNSYKQRKTLELAFFITFIPSLLFFSIPTLVLQFFLGHKTLVLQFNNQNWLFNIMSDKMLN